MNTILIDIFGMLPKADKANKAVAFNELNRTAVRLGYLIPEDGCTETAREWLGQMTADPNATFYKEWTDVLSRNRFELFHDQLRHYASTYGTDFGGAAWTPNDGQRQTPDFTQLKVPRTGTREDFIEAARKLLTSGIALKGTVIHAVVDFLVTMEKEGATTVEIDAVKCREAKAALAVGLNRYPKDEFGLLRCLVYAHTEKCELIKEKQLIGSIKYAAREILEEAGFTEDAENPEIDFSSPSATSIIDLMAS